MTARAPSPMAKATRLVVPLRQSPLANTPGKLVSSTALGQNEISIIALIRAGDTSTY